MVTSRIRVAKNIYGDNYEFVIWQKHSNGKCFAGKPIIFEETDEYGMAHQPTFSICYDDKKFIQDFFDELYRLGFRPTAEVEEPKAIKAIQYHLEDMRRLVFKEQES